MHRQNRPDGLSVITTHDDPLEDEADFLKEVILSITNTRHIFKVLFALPLPKGLLKMILRVLAEWKKKGSNNPYRTANE